MKQKIIKPSESALPTESEAKKELLVPFPLEKGVGFFEFNKTFMENYKNRNL